MQNPLQRRLPLMATTWILGSMGWMPSRDQQTACVLVELQDDLVLLDAGTGVANLALCTNVLGRHERLHVLLSHYHLDHMAGLMYLKRFTANPSLAFSTTVL
jgi:ribonuclease BN (tRNA processing enzyme)